MNPIEYTHPGTPPHDDPEIEAAMRVWDVLSGRERREVFRTLYRSAVAYERTEHDEAHLEFRWVISAPGVAEEFTDPVTASVTG